MSDPTRIQLLELDLDIRLAGLWRETTDVREWNLEHVAAFMRAAYGIGFVAALTESAPERLFTDHGYAPPVRGRS